MKTKLLIFLSCLSLISTVYAACDECDSSGCNSTYDTCSCTDPACNNPYSCMSPSTCCATFGNIGAFDSAQAETTYSYGYSNLIIADSYSYAPAPARIYRPSYKGE